MKSILTTRCTYGLLLLIATVILLTSGCAPQPVQGNLQRQIEDLLRAQEQQAAELAELKQQLAAYNLQPQENMASKVEPMAELSEQPTEPAAEVAPLDTSGSEEVVLTTGTAAADIAEMSEAASLYLESFAAIATGRMSEAEAGFKEFTERYPDHEYTGNANYWRAEALIAQQKPRLAETLLLEIIDNPQQENKAPAAMARLIRFYRDSGAEDNAEAMLQLMNDRFPDSPELHRLLRSTEPR